MTKVAIDKEHSSFQVACRLIFHRHVCCALPGTTSHHWRPTATAASELSVPHIRHRRCCVSQIPVNSLFGDEKRTTRNEESLRWCHQTTAARSADTRRRPTRCLFIRRPSTSGWSATLCGFRPLEPPIHGVHDARAVSKQIRKVLPAGPYNK